MDPRLLDYYNRELQHIREMGGEFARQFPKIAGRLGLDGIECSDPYVERLLEGFAFLAARVQLKIDSEAPTFTQHLLEMVYPHYLAPTPSMVVVQFQPDLTEGGLAEGAVIPRHSDLRSRLGKGDRTACEYRTAHEVTLWPLKLAEAEYFTHSRLLSAIDIRAKDDVRAGIRLRLQATAGLNFEKLPLDSVTFYLRGADEQPMHLYEQLLANVVSIVAVPVQRKLRDYRCLDPSHLRPVGFDDVHALLPHGPRSFQGYRLLQEYFSFPSRFMFVELDRLSSVVRQCKGSEIDVLILFDRLEPALQNAVDTSNFELFCTPAVNLFSKRADRIHLDRTHSEYHVIPDRTRPMDYEVHSITEVVGHGTTAEDKQSFLPFYASSDRTSDRQPMAYYTTERVPRVLSSKERRVGARSSYVGSEVYVSLVDGRQAPYRTDLSQLSLSTLCTNRDLPLHLSLGGGQTDFTLTLGVPVEAVRCLAGPSPPQSAHVAGETTWRLISHLSLNYLSLTDDKDGGASGLRDLLRLYGETKDSTIRRQIDGVRSVESRSVTRRLPISGPITFGRGLEVTLTFDEEAFEGTGVFLLGAVLDQFFARYVAINSFTETVVKTRDRGEVVRWPVRLGRRHKL